MTSDAAPPAADRPAYYRLSTETWLLILKEYREGATAPFLARKWRVSEQAVRRRATRHGSTKRDWGDAQAIGQALAREAEFEEARRNAPEAVAARLFSGIDLEDDEGDPAVLARIAALVSGRAMKGRLWTEAKALAGLAESYARLSGLGVQAAGTSGRSPKEEASMDFIMERLDAAERDAERLRELEMELERRTGDGG